MSHGLTLHVDSAITFAAAQCQDISQLGTVNELSRLILPPGSRLLTATSREFTEPDRDLSAFQGFLLQPRQTIYRCTCWSFCFGDEHILRIAQRSYLPLLNTAAAHAITN